MLCSLRTILEISRNWNSRNLQEKITHITAPFYPFSGIFPWNYTYWKNKWVIKYFFFRERVIFYTSSPWLRISDILVQKPLAGKRKNATCHHCCPQCNTPHAFPSPKLHILLSSLLSLLNKFACFSFAKLKGAICVLLCLPLLVIALDVFQQQLGS